MHDGRDGDPDRLTRAPDVPAAVAGWRCWTLGGPDQVELVSPVRIAGWPAGRATVAQCTSGHSAPNPGCSCGLYALRELPAGYAVGADVLGCVALWGRVVEGRSGFRAERGYPVVLLASGDLDEERCTRLAMAYGVPVHRLPAAPGELLYFHDRLEAAAERVRTAATGPEPGVLAAHVEDLLTDARAVVPLIDDTVRSLAGRGSGAVPPAFRPRRGAWDRVLDGLWAAGFWLGFALQALLGLVAVLAAPAAVIGVCIAVIVALQPHPLTLFAARQAAGAPPGTCIQAEQNWNERTVTTEDVCGREHWGEVLGHRPLGPVPSPYPGADQVAATALFECRWLLAARGLSESDHRVLVTLPNEPSWNRGGGEYENYTTCAVAPVTGRLLPAGRLVDPGRPLDDDVVVPSGLFTASVWANAPTGACIAPGAATFDADPVPVVRCDRAHRAEVLGYPTLSPPGTPWPGDDAVYAAAEAACDRLSATRRPPAGFVTTLIWPARTWFDDPAWPHYTTCLLVRSDGGAWAGPPR